MQKVSWKLRRKVLGGKIEQLDSLLTFSLFFQCCRLDDTTARRRTEMRFGDDVDALVAQSPSLQKDLLRLEKDDWKIKYGAPGKGSFATRGDEQTITLDGNLKGNALATTQTLAHEVGYPDFAKLDDLALADSAIDEKLGFARAKAIVALANRALKRGPEPMA